MKTYYYETERSLSPRQFQAKSDIEAIYFATKTDPTIVILYTDDGSSQEDCFLRTVWEKERYE